MSRPRLLLIDGHSVAYRAFFALPVASFGTSTGQPTNAVFGFTSMLINMLREEEPTHLVVAFDVSRRSFRTDEYPEYKATRSASPEEFKGQVELIKEVLDALAIVHVEQAGFEADDLIATLATTASQADYEVLICTGDRDALQLVNDSVTLLYPRKGVSDLARLTPEAVAEKYLVPPQRYPELAALVGETSDNLPGVPGVGPKTAAKWLTKYDGLENLLQQAEQVPGKAGESLRSHIAEVTRNRRLNALVTDVSLPIELEDTKRRQWEQEQVDKMFAALEFRALKSRLAELAPRAEAVPVPELRGRQLLEGEVANWLATYAVSATGAQFVGSWHAGRGDLEGLALAGSGGENAYLELTELSPQDDAALASWLADPERHKVMHDSKGPQQACWERGYQLLGISFDTKLAAYLIRPDQRSYELADLAISYLGRELASPEGKDVSAQQELQFEEPDRGLDAMAAARGILELSELLTTELASWSGTKLLQDLELPVQQRLAELERHGIAIDAELLKSLEQDFDTAVEDAQSRAFEVLGHEVNLGSPKQLQGVLFEELEMPKTRKTKLGYTTDAEALAELHAKTEHPFLEHLLAHRDAIRMRQTVAGLIQAIQPDGRIHTTYSQTMAATGRLSSQDPNLQNIPVRTAVGRRIREAFVPGAGYESLMSADYSQIEMRLMAHASGDPKLIEAFRSGRDFHNEMAVTVFSVAPDEVTPEMRARIKAMNYGLAYGLSAFGLSNQLKIPVEEARSLMDDYFDRVGGVRDYLNGLVEAARLNGYTETLLGRRRYLPELTSSNRQRREMAERAALNSPIQGSAADVIKLATLDVAEGLATAELKSRILLQVHDELILEIAPGESEQIAELVHDKMANAMQLEVPLAVSIGNGPSWHAAAH